MIACICGGFFEPIFFTIAGMIGWIILKFRSR